MTKYQVASDKAQGQRTIEGTLKNAGFAYDFVTMGNGAAKFLIPLWILYVGHAIGVY